MDNRRFTGVIPVRTGSQRVKEKNLRLFADTCLLKIKLDVLMQVSLFDKIVVNTDSQQAIDIAKEYSSKDKRISFYNRDSYYASSQCSGSEFFEHMGQVTDTDIFVYCPCTSPLIKPSTYLACIEKYKNLTEHDSLSTVSSIKDFLWLDGNPINYDPANAPNSQDLPHIVALNFGVNIISREKLIERKNIIGVSPFFMEIDDCESFDIDTELDFYIVEQIYKKTVFEKKGLLET